MSNKVRQLETGQGGYHVWLLHLSEVESMCAIAVASFPGTPQLFLLQAIKAGDEATIAVLHTLHALCNPLCLYPTLGVTLPGSWPAGPSWC